MPDCEFNGIRYRPGERFRDLNGCGMCTCDSSGSVDCSDDFCDGRKLQLILCQLLNFFYELGFLK